MLVNTDNSSQRPPKNRFRTVRRKSEGIASGIGKEIWEYF
jgi:hypothetical protein